jgi:tetratricopeptide (TPR) repeat protein
VTGFSTREVADVLGLPTSRILSLTRSGLITPARGPRGAYVFSFQDLVLLRQARELLESDVPASRVKRALEALRQQLPVGRPLSAVDITAMGSRVLVRDEDRVWEPDTGQMRIDFADQGEAGTVGSPRGDEPVRLNREDPGPSVTDAAAGALGSADEWYDAAVDLEAVSVGEAIDAYTRAIDLDPAHSDAHLNLGRLLHEAGRLEEAEAHYRQAVQADPRSARAFYNLGVALEDRGLRPGAVEAYEAALRLDSELAVAHFNLARLFEAAGREPEAIGHLAEYKRLIRRGGVGA